MALAPQKKREIIVQYLFSQEFFKSSEQDLIALLMNEHKVSRKNVADSIARANEILTQVKKEDAYIEKVSTGWAVDRIQIVERTILRVAIFEMLIEESIPPSVIISEAKRLAKKFSTDDAAVFIHALLNSLVKKDEVKVS